MKPLQKAPPKGNELVKKASMRYTHIHSKNMYLSLEVKKSPANCFDISQNKSSPWGESILNKHRMTANKGWESIEKNKKKNQDTLMNRTSKKKKTFMWNNFFLTLLMYLLSWWKRTVAVGTFSQDAKYVPISTYHCSFQQKLMLEVIKQWAFVIVFVNSYAQLHMFRFKDETSFLGSSAGTELDLRCGILGYESR